MNPGELSVSVARHRAPCVLDPALVLDHALGPELALGLAGVFEAWLTRSFWQVLDASDLLIRHRAWPHPPRRAAASPDPRALLAWLALRDTTDAASWTLRWLGDNLAESQLGTGAGAAVLDRHEQLLAAWGGDLVPVSADGFDPRAGALDALALSATLGGAVVLCRTRPGRVPWPVEVLKVLGERVQVAALDPMPDDSLFAVERHRLRDALVVAGLATVVERLCGPGTRLAVVHLALDEGDEAADDAAALRPRGVAWWYVV